MFTHLLVQFCEEEDSTSIIPVKHVKMKEGLAVGDDCSVTWSNRKVYTGIVVCAKHLYTNKNCILTFYLKHTKYKPVVHYL